MGFGQLFSNNAATQSTNAPLAVGGTTLSVTATHGAFFQDVLVADEWELLTILDDPFEPTVIEIVRVTAHDSGGGSPDDFTIVRGQEGTTPVEWPAGSYVQARATAGSYQRFAQGDPGGDPRGIYAINLQRDRDAAAYVASGSRSIAIGQGMNRAYGGSAVAIGHDARADGSDTLAAGYYAYAYANRSTALGNRSYAGGVNSLAVGYSADTFGDYSVAVGTAQANGNQAVAIGTYAGAQDYSIGIGYQADGSGPYATAIGHSTYADYYGTALGYNASATQRGVAVGAGANVGGYRGIAIGQDSVAGARAVAIGYGALANALFRLAIGAGAYANDDRAFALGAYAQATQGYAMAIGYNAQASGSYSIALGYGAYANGSNGMAIGDNTYAYTGALAVGYGASAGNPYGIAIGYGANSAYNYAVGIGFQAQPQGDNLTHIAGPIHIPKITVPYADADARLRAMAGAEVVLLTNSYDLTDATPFDGGTLGNKNFWDLPAGLLFYPDEVGIMTDTQNTVTTGPTVSFGHGGTGTEILNNQAFSNTLLGQAGGRAEYASANLQGVNIVSIAVNGAASATTLTGRFYIRGVIAGAGS